MAHDHWLAGWLIDSQLHMLRVIDALPVVACRHCDCKRNNKESLCLFIVFSYTFHLVLFDYFFYWKRSMAIIIIITCFDHRLPLAWVSLFLRLLPRSIAWQPPLPIRVDVIISLFPVSCWRFIGTHWQYATRVNLLLLLHLMQRL